MGPLHYVFSRIQIDVRIGWLAKLVSGKITPGIIRMSAIELFATAQGTTAKKVLSSAPRASVSGITSRGIFLRIDPDDVIFLSFEPYKGPLTLIIAGDVSGLSRVKQADSVNVQDGNIFFITSGIKIITQRTETWDVPSRSNAALEPPERNQRIKAIASEMRAKRVPVGLGEVLTGLFNVGNKDALIAASSSPSIDFRNLMRVTHPPDLTDLLPALESVLGLGAGLTPSGDDLIIGLLLAYNRWKDALNPLLDISKLNETVRRMAFQKTTLISAHLIACAADGMADERLITALDGIMTGVPEGPACADALLNWGSTSGYDTLAGMVLAAYDGPALL
jgi:hypothetical protein